MTELTLNARGKWAILFYTNGNNELEPEMRFSMNEIRSAGEVPNVLVALQIARESYELVKKVRSSIPPPDPYEYWEGARRYALRGSQLELIENLGSVNMAHPQTLMEFLTWGFAHFPAEKYMLIVGGHSWQYLGTMTDYSQNEPYIMGIPGLVEAINLASSRAGLQIELVIFDTCHFNEIEVLYELGADPCCAVKNMATYLGTGPLQGLSSRAIVQGTDRLSHIDNPRVFIKNFIKGLGESMVACSINHCHLSLIKNLYNRVALEYNNVSRGSISFQRLLHGNSSDAWYGTLIDLKENLRNLVITVTNPSQGQGIINVASQRTDNLECIRRYCMLGFARDNYWLQLLSEENMQITELLLKDNVIFKPLKLSASAIYKFISIVNPTLPTEQNIERYLALVRYKKWNAIM